MKHWLYGKPEAKFGGPKHAPGIQRKPKLRSVNKGPGNGSGKLRSLAMYLRPPPEAQQKPYTDANVDLEHWAPCDYEPCTLKPKTDRCLAPRAFVLQRFEEDFEQQKTQTKHILAADLKTRTRIVRRSEAVEERLVM